MRSTFASLIFAAAASVTVTLATSTPVRAEIDYPWCAILSTQGGSQSCTFANVEQCRAYASAGGFCFRNPRASAMGEMPRGARR